MNTKRMVQVRALVAAVLMAGSTVPLGCHQARWEAARQRRDANIGRVSEAYERTEGRRPASRQHVFDTIERQESHRAESREHVWHQIERVEGSRAAKWEGEGPVRRRWLRRIPEGNPEAIPDVWAKLAY